MQTTLELKDHGTAGCAASGVDESTLVLDGLGSFPQEHHLTEMHLDRQRNRRMLQGGLPVPDTQAFR